MFSNFHLKPLPQQISGTQVKRKRQTLLFVFGFVGKGDLDNLQREQMCFISSVRSSSGYHGLIRTYPAQQQPTFSDFSNSSDSKVKVKVKGPNMCYIFEKHGIQGYRI